MLCNMGLLDGSDTDPRGVVRDAGAPVPCAEPGAERDAVHADDLNIAARGARS
jgi:hypothetical protein